MSVLASPEYVSAGARMTWTGQFSYGANSLKNEAISASPYDAVSQVGAVVKNNFALVIERSDNGVDWWTKNGKITLYLRTDMDRGDGETDDGLTDIGQNVADAFTTQGFPCQSWAISSYTPAPAGDGSTTATAIQTGTAQTTVQQQQQADTAASGGGFFSGLGFGGVGSSLASGGIGLLIGGALALGLVVFILLQPKAAVAV